MARRARWKRGKQNRWAARALRLEWLESRDLLAQTMTGFGVAGDSLSDEYAGESCAYARNWVELLAQEQHFPLGTQGAWGEPRREGYEFNWARWGATSTTLLSSGQHTGLGLQMAFGRVSHAVLAIGQNDFIPSGAAYQNIYAGIWTSPQTASYVDTVAGNIDTALATLAAQDVELVVSNVVDYGIAPITRQFFTDANRREAVTNVIAGLNTRIQALAQEYRVPLIDTFRLTKDIFGTNSAIIPSSTIGGVTITNTAGTQPTHAFVHDGAHPHTVVQAGLANLVLSGFNLGYGEQFDLFTEAEMVTLAGLTYGGQDTFGVDFSEYVVLPTSFTVTETGGATGVAESGTTDTFEVVLDVAPQSNVVLTISSADLGEATVSPVTLTFTPTDWNVAQTVTVTGVNDDQVDGDRTTAITISVDDANSDDLFDPLPDQTVQVTTVDNDRSVFRLGVAGDSLSDEYEEASYAYARNWVESLAAAVDVGAQGTWGPPRDEGFEYNWAQAGATTHTLLASEQHIGLAQQIAAGLIDYAALAIGQNDFGPWTAAYLGMYGGTWTEAQIEAYVGQVVTNIGTALQTLVAAGGKVVLSNVIDYGVAPITRQFLTDPAGRERVTDAIRRVNTELAGLAQQYGVPLIDGFQATKDFLGTNQAPVTTVAIGGVDFANAAGVEPQNLFVDDGIHPHTVGQAVIANLVVEAIRLGYGQDVDAIGFTEREMLELVGLGSQYVSDTLNLDYADYVILPNRWQNPLNNWDVSGDGKVHPIDALKIINYINAHPGDPSVPAWPAVPPPFFDVTGDNAITPADVLTVINYINSHSASGEGEPTADAVSGALAWAGPSDDTALDQAVLPRPTVLNGLDGRSSRDLPSRAFHRPREIARGTDDLAPPDREPVRWPQVASRRWDLGAARPDVLGGEFEETLEQIAGDVAGAWSAALRGL